MTSKAYPEALEAFQLALDHDRPPRAVVVSRECVMLDPAGAEGFEIRDSHGRQVTVGVRPSRHRNPRRLFG